MTGRNEIAADSMAEEGLLRAGGVPPDQLHAGLQFAAATSAESLLSQPAFLTPENGAATGLPRVVLLIAAKAPGIFREIIEGYRSSIDKRSAAHDQKSRTV